MSIQNVLMFIHHLQKCQTAWVAVPPHCCSWQSSSVPFARQIFCKAVKKPPTSQACFLNHTVTCGLQQPLCRQLPLACVSFNRDTQVASSPCVTWPCHLVFWSAHKIQPANPGTCKSVCTFVLGLLCPGLTEDAAFVHPVSGYTAIVCLRSPF